MGIGYVRQCHRLTICFFISDLTIRYFCETSRLVYLLEPTCMNNEHYILKYTHPYLLSNRTCSKYFVISNAAIDSLLLGLSDLSQLSGRQVLEDSRTGMFGKLHYWINRLKKICTLWHSVSQS